ncbi:inositol hexakisphosphate and diphosphoinositol-pentakisphosphate kinase 2 isoform X1 [Lingula anatina]|uniref:Inositol hexakisphosphate and diphosphoinositol-pentakisphosphate kinase n=1 Tax=Lingula anatina TaxID=7574 RepID=A0A1S3HLG7_LINAN|nr:inositol hexakisphosphate and diphosphoinositol-pentakisphosphate kinase 2 isoform X1 [Lingula anatina]XP_013386867.1 inositol hexakisphosphate and diphosphoinositol-pentakisphosphate kinase 2 isoform X1 [Lingula anatina]|eukprot:XP_013386864.1 inositol hexakisphosphate and diphosphoinositol-pentakisphosphate kinase 2 isoform X1 [Lingula anatina]
MVDMVPPSNVEWCWDSGEDSDVDEGDAGEVKKIIVGICAMKKKSHSKPMREIIERLKRFEYIEILIFDEQVILNEPVENWPLCDCLISFYSSGFPLDKAVAYEKLRKPFVSNDLSMQYDIQDRRAVHELLSIEGIPQPRYAVLDRDCGDPKKCLLIEGDDQIEVNGIVFQKPFVEKPVSAEDHNVYIYYPTSAGGGSQRLFRKIGSRSSVYSPVNKVRKTGSYIYEQFMPTDGTDIKVYTLGPDYAHAEARKSPALDGKVERDKDGKEVRYPILLSAKEKLIARKVCLAFKQMVCGFDLLRANGECYVCDVNGFSFVKTSMKYYDDCAKILGNMIIRHFAPQLSIPIYYQPEDPPIVPTTCGTMMELRCVIAVIRHGDRTPKQKMKMEAKHKRFFDLFEKYDGFKTGQLKLKRPRQLQEILDIARALLLEIEAHPANPEVEEKKSKLEQLKAVLEMYGHFSGINRKVQLKYQPHGAPKKSSDEVSDGELSSHAADPGPSLVLILKWGGELTPAGKMQAEELGKAFRCMYPGGEGDYGNTPGLGFLRLHSTFRHDLKIYASDEGRVQMTAAAFTKGLLALEGELAPVLVQMVKSADTNGLLDEDREAAKYQNKIKAKLKQILNEDKDFEEEDIQQLCEDSQSIRTALMFIKNPRQMCKRIHALIQKLTGRIKQLKADPRTRGKTLYHNETWELMQRRWGKLERDFHQRSGLFDISKLPDIYDCIKYDLQHNQEALQFDNTEELYVCSKAMADLIIPQEYGLSKEDKLCIGTSISSPLLKKIYSDLQSNLEEDFTRLDSRYCKGVSTPYRHVRTRLYFTSESHIHSLLNVIRYGGLLDDLTDEQWKRAMEYIGSVSELNYMTQLVLMLYEDPSQELGSDKRFHVELHFSPGAYTCNMEKDKDFPVGTGYRPKEQKESVKVHPDAVPSRPDVSTHTTPQEAAIPAQTSQSAKADGDFTMEEIMEPQSAPVILENDTLVEEEEGRSTQIPASGVTSSVSNSQVQASPKSTAKPIDIQKKRFRVIPRSDDSLVAPSVETITEVEETKIRSQNSSPDPTNHSKSAEDKTTSPSDCIPDYHVYHTIHAIPVPKYYSFASLFSQIGHHDQNTMEKATISLPCGTGSANSSAPTSPSPGAPNSPLKYNVYHTIQGLSGHHRHSFAGFLGRKRGRLGSGDSLGSSGSLFSTRLIGSSSSTPNLYDEEGRQIEMGVESCPRVPEIRPLETLHNSLTLKQMEHFLQKITEMVFYTPKSTPPRTPRGVPTPVGGAKKKGMHLPSLGCSSSNSSAGPSSPTSGSTPDDILNKLRHLIDTASNRDQHESQTTDQESSKTSTRCSSLAKSPGGGNSDKSPGFNFSDKSPGSSTNDSLNLDKSLCDLDATSADVEGATADVADKMKVS